MLLCVNASRYKIWETLLLGFLSLLASDYDYSSIFWNRGNTPLFSSVHRIFPILFTEINIFFFCKQLLFPFLYFVCVFVLQSKIKRCWRFHLLIFCDFYTNVRFSYCIEWQIYVLWNFNLLYYLLINL
jgi:hypothetical protein